MDVVHASAAHRVLAIPELLNLILGYGERPMHYNCTFVCKQWSSVSLDRLWFKVEDLKALLEILCPMEQYMQRWVCYQLLSLSLCLVNGLVLNC